MVGDKNDVSVGADILQARARERAAAGEEEEEVMGEQSVVRD